MCENILTETLNNKIHLNLLLNWLEGLNTKEFDFEEVTKWNCDRVAFISFFLNYIHDATIRCEVDVPTETRVEEMPVPVTPVRSILFDTNSNFVSPLYKPKKTATPKTPPSICLGDFLIRRDTKKKVQRNLNENAFNEGVRRINPTSVSPKHSTTSTTNKNSFSFDKEDDDLVGVGEEVAKVTSPVVVPNIDSVSFRQQLKILARVYSFLLDNCLVVNVTSELYFVVTMLLCKSSNGVVANSTHLLSSTHNQVYFAVCVLSKQQCFLNVLDKFTVRLLVENNRFEQFADVRFLRGVRRALDGKAETCLVGGQDEQGSVYFACDTDNRSNFPNDSSFRNFRKQRDMFYEILRAWDSQHLLLDWSFDRMLGSKIRALINMHGEPCNFMHFAKLFKAQLINSACWNPGAGDALISSMPNVDAEKLSRLNTRMIGKQNSSGLNAIPTFTGHQEFFRDFILIANSYLFNKHLIDALVAEIIHLNDFPLDIEEFNIHDGTIKKLYLDRLKSLRILAKFLGFLEALPYKSECNRLSQDVVQCQLKLRNQVQTTLNFKEIILDAVRKKTLTLTIPWLTKYLAMLDPVSLKLTRLQEAIQLLFQIYYGIRCGPIIVKLTLGWLFDLPHFPNELYYAWVSRAIHAQLPKPDPVDFHLDDLGIFDHGVAYICCPYLDEIKKILLSDANETNRTITFKHITPISTTESSSDASSRRTQKQLEEAFFRGQPDSVKKTVDFVSERVASGCVKEICYDMVAAHKQSSLARLRNDLDQAGDLHELRKKMAALSLENLKNDIDKNIKALTTCRITASMDALLATVVLKETKELCVAIATRTCLERVQEWVHTHVQEEIFINHFKAEVRKPDEANSTKSKTVFNLPLFGKSRAHNTDTLSGVDLMKALREFSCKIIAESEAFTTTHVTQLLESIQRSLKERCDINDTILLSINRMLLDFLLLLISHKPEMATESLLENCCALFKESSELDDLFKGVISPRNDFFLSKSQYFRLSCRRFNTFLDALVGHELLSAGGLQEQATRCCSSDQGLLCLQEMLSLRISGS